MQRPLWCCLGRVEKKEKDLNLTFKTFTGELFQLFVQKITLKKKVFNVLSNLHFKKCLINCFNNN